MGTVYAAGVSPFGQFGSYDKVEITVEGVKVPEKGVVIEDQLYIPVGTLFNQKKLAYTYDPATYSAYLFFGGGKSESSSYYFSDSIGGGKSRSDIAKELMNGIPYEAKDYHSGMMRQDIVNIVSLSKSLLSTSDSMANAVQTKLTTNRNPNIEMVKQAVYYRSVPLELMQDRMEALADELGRQIGSKPKRQMNDVIDYIDDALKNKKKALEALEDWLRTSDEDDLEDYRDYEEEVKENIYDAVEILNGENLKKSGERKENNLLSKVNEWIAKQGR